MAGLQRVRANDMMWMRNELGSLVYRLPTSGAQLTIVRGRKGEHVPTRGHTRGAVIYVASGRLRLNGDEYLPGDAAVFAPGHEHYFGGQFLEDTVYVVARAADDELTLPDLGEMAAAYPDA